MAHFEPKNAWELYSTEIETEWTSFTSEVVPTYDQCWNTFYKLHIIGKEAGMLRSEARRAGTFGDSDMKNYRKRIGLRIVELELDILYHYVKDFHAGRYFEFLRTIVEDPSTKWLERKNFGKVRNYSFASTGRIWPIRASTHSLVNSE